MLTVMLDDDHLFDTLPQGARGYLIKGTDPGTLVTALRNTLDGEPALSPRNRDALIVEHLGHAGHTAGTRARRRHGAALAAGGRGARPAPPGIADEQHRRAGCSSRR